MPEQDGHLVGVPLPGDTMVSNHLEMIYKFKIKDEMWLCIRTDVMREYPFPEIEVRYFPEAIVWTKIARRYKTLYVNEMLHVYMAGSAIANAAVALLPTMLLEAGSRSCQY